eukprot:SAG11_NODE_846_length_6884_cov_5.651732_8_plen_82_part_00
MAGGGAGQYSDDDEALARANATQLGLGGSVWSADIAKANQMARPAPRGGLCGLRGPVAAPPATQQGGGGGGGGHLHLRNPQ